MIIKKLNASFGNLNNDTLEFKDGLNIVQASNEAGKSTWCAFIRTMLYGINTADRDKAGYLSDKTRYMPWNGAPMEGTMDIHWGNSDISIRRSSLRAAPMKNFSAVYSDTSENVQWLNGENAGETLTGVPEKVFERSVFIRQAGLDINQTAELEKRMTSIVSSGDEHTSYSEADSRLREWLRKRRFKQSGQLPKLEGDIQSVEKKLSRLEEINSAAADLRLETEQATRTKKELEEELKTHDIIDRAMEYKRVLEAKQTAEDENAAVEEAKKHLIHNGRLATKNDIAAARDSLSHIQQLQMKISSSNSERDTLASEITSLKKEIDDSPFSGSTPEGADSAAESSISEYNTALAASQKKPRASTILFIISLISALGSFAVLWYMKLAQIFYAIPGGLLILAIVFLIVLISKNTSASKARKLGLSILEKYHASGTEEIKALAGKYRTAYDKAEETQDKLSETEATLELLSTELESTKAELENQLLAFSDEAAGIENANEIITKTDKLADELAQAEMRKSAADNIYTTLSKAAGDFSDFT